MKILVIYKKILEKIWLMSLLCSLSLFSLGQATSTNVTFYSNSLEMERNVQIYLPEGYTEQESVRYPVIYFLHGAGQNSTSHSVLLTAYNNLVKTIRDPALHHRQTGWKLPAMGKKLFYKLGIVREF